MPDYTLSNAFEDFLNDAMTGSRLTQRTYRTALNALAAFLLQEGVVAETAPVSELTIDRAQRWSTWLLNEHVQPNGKVGVSKRSFHTYLAALAGLIRYLNMNNRLSFSGPELEHFKDRLRYVRRSQKLPQLLPHPPTPEQMDALVQAAHTAEATPDDQRAELRRLRNVAIVEALHTSGLRVGELVKMRRKDLRPEDRSAWIVGKGDKERQVFFDAAAWRSIHTYLEYRQVHDGATGRALGDLPVFARHDRKAGKRILPMSTEAVEEVLKELAGAAGLAAAGITPHALRHYFATRIYQATHDLAVTQDALGHSTPATTRVYAKLDDRAVRDAHEEAFGKR
ncbi:MAG: tyrosine-type recombinase/integrase [Anaerolineae bacterium]|nr:tyrosine-type recombinase/integrase [Anaerolineae bacterium]